MSAVDPLILQQLADDMPPAALRELLATFQADLARLASELEAACGRGAEDACRELNHAIAGAAAGMGALRLEQAARAAMQPEDAPDHEARVRSVLDEVGPVQDALRALAVPSEGTPKT